jgi:terminase, large subunit
VNRVRLNKYHVESIRTKEQKDAFILWLADQVARMPRGIPVMPASQWIEKHIVIVEGDYQGQYSFKLTPYLREPADRMSIRSLTTEMAILKSNQLGFSVLSFALICYFVYYGIGPQLFISGDESMAAETFEKRLDPMLEASGLRHFIKPMVKKNGLARATGDTKGVKSYGGTFMRAIGPHSEGKLRSFPSRINIIEEIDVFPQSLKGTGNPIEKAIRRADHFGPNKRIYYNSTPKEKNTSQILPLFDAGTQSQYTWLCPDCGHRQPFVWDGFDWERDEHGAPKVDMDDEGRVTHDPVFYVCQNDECKRKIYEHEKFKMLLDETMGGTAAYIPQKKPDRPGLWSAHVPSYYSPTRSWLDIILNYWRVKDDPLLYADFVNDSQGLPSDTTVAKPEPHFLMRRAEGWSRESSSVPSGVIFTTVQCDVQGDRLEAALLGWGHNREMWVLQYYTFFGDTSETDANCWKELSAVIEADHKRDDGIDLGPPVIAFVDAGFNTTAVHYFCSQYPPVSTRYYWNGVYPVEGRDNLGNKYYRAFDCDIANPKIAINDQKFKHVLYAYVNKDRPQGGASYPTGYIHFPCDLSEDFYKQLVAEEQYEERQKNGKKVYRIENRKGRRNEALDIVKMGYASVYYLCMQWYEDINKKRRLQKKHELELSWPAFFDMMESRNQP